MDDDASPQCYVCTEATPPLMHDLCACRERYVHPQCQDALLARVDRDGTCSVCKTPYANVQRTVERRTNPIYWCKCTLLALTRLGALVLVIGFGVHLYFALHPPVLRWCASLAPPRNLTTTKESDDWCFDLGPFFRTTMISLLVLLGLCLVAAILGSVLIARHYRGTQRYLAHARVVRVVHDEQRL